MSAGLPYKKTGGYGKCDVYGKPHYKKQGANLGTRYPHTVLAFAGDTGKSEHPTQKPVALLEYLIRTYTQEGETVLDFTMGSGSTGVACVNTGRDFIGIELDEGYYNIAQKRIEQARTTGKQMILTKEDKEQDDQQG